MTPRKHCELIKAWADGASIQWRRNKLVEWETIYPPAVPFWADRLEYRIKPEPEKMHVRLYKAKSGLILNVITVDKSSVASRDYNWVSDWVEVELYSEDE